MRLWENYSSLSTQTRINKKAQLFKTHIYVHLIVRHDFHLKYLYAYAYFMQFLKMITNENILHNTSDPGNLWSFHHTNKPLSPSAPYWWSLTFWFLKNIIMALHNDDLLYLGILLNTWIIKINISQTEINCNTLHATALENFHHNLDFPLASPAEQELEGQSKKRKKRETESRLRKGGRERRNKKERMI